MTAPYDPLPLARAILEDYDSPPRAVIAAWKCLYRDDYDDLLDLAYKAAALPAETSAA